MKVGVFGPFSVSYQTVAPPPTPYIFTQLRLICGYSSETAKSATAFNNNVKQFIQLIVHIFFTKRIVDAKKTVVETAVFRDYSPIIPPNFSMTTFFWGYNADEKRNANYFWREFAVNVYGLCHRAGYDWQWRAASGGKLETTSMLNASQFRAEQLARFISISSLVWPLRLKTQTKIANRRPSRRAGIRPDVLRDNEFGNATGTRKWVSVPVFEILCVITHFHSRNLGGLGGVVTSSLNNRYHPCFVW